MLIEIKDIRMESMMHASAAALALAVLPTLGCASTPPPAAPSSAAPALPPPAAPGDLPPRRGPLVHIANADPSKPLALYSFEPVDVGGRYVRPPPMHNSIGGSRQAFSEYVVVDEGVERLICLAPCDREVVVPLSHEMFLGGEGITPSDRFRLGPGLGRAEIEATPGSVHRTRGGTALVAIGGVAAVFGAVALPASVAGGPLPKAVGGGFLGAGAALLAAGIPLLITGKTRYTLRRPEVALRF